MATQIFLDPKIERKVSLVSAWEIQIKHAVGKRELPEMADEVVPRCARAIRAQIVSFEGIDISALYRLPNIHRDPFDRMLIAQAITSNWILISPDEIFKQYPVQWTL